MKVAEDQGAMLDCWVRLARVGMARVTGYLEGGMAGWFGAGLLVAPLGQIPVEDPQRELDPVQLVDVRQPGEWEQGHIAEACRGRCRGWCSRWTGWTGSGRSRCTANRGTGVRSGRACRSGKAFGEVANVIGRIDAWKACGLPVV